MTCPRTRFVVENYAHANNDWSPDDLRSSSCIRINVFRPAFPVWQRHIDIKGTSWRYAMPSDLVVTLQDAHAILLAIENPVMFKVDKAISSIPVGSTKTVIKSYLVPKGLHSFLKKAILVGAIISCSVHSHVNQQLLRKARST